jgi:hypothetical protein
MCTLQSNQFTLLLSTSSPFVTSQFILFCSLKSKIFLIVFGCYHLSVNNTRYKILSQNVAHSGIIVVFAHHNKCNIFDS